MKKTGTHDGHPETNIRFSEPPTDEIVFPRKNLLNLIQPCEHDLHGRLVRLLLRREARAVDAVCEASLAPWQYDSKRRLTVDFGVHPLINRVDLGAVLCRVEVERGLVRRDNIVKCRVQHADDFGRLVVHDRVVRLREDKQTRRKWGRKSPCPREWVP